MELRYIFITIFSQKKMALLLASYFCEDEISTVQFWEHVE